MQQQLVCSCLALTTPGCDQPCLTSPVSFIAASHKGTNCDILAVFLPQLCHPFPLAVGISVPGRGAGSREPEAVPPPGPPLRGASCGPGRSGAGRALGWLCLLIPSLPELASRSSLPHGVCVSVCPRCRWKLRAAPLARRARAV